MSQTTPTSAHPTAAGQAAGARSTEAQAAGGHGPVMSRAQTPVGSGRIGLVGVILAILTIGLGLVGVRDALISAQVLTGRAWIEGAIDFLDGMKPQWWVVPVGVLIALLGLWLLLISLRPRPRTAVALQSQTGVFMRLRDVKKIAKRAADDVDGVLSARASATRRVVKIAVTATGEDPRIEEEVRTTVQEALSALDPVPRITVTSRRDAGL